MSVKWELEETDVEWEMKWGAQAVARGRPETEMMFEEKGALAHLLINEVVFINSHRFKDEWPKEARETIALFVNCNDVFAWGCADGEELPHSQIEKLYRMWREKPWGAKVWCLIQRKQMPQAPVEKHMRAAGWDLDALKEEYGLRPNHYDGISSILAKRKYATYSAWAKEQGQEPRPFDASWWDGWNEYRTANLGWCNQTWADEDVRLCDEWRKENGYADD